MSPLIVALVVVCAALAGCSPNSATETSVESSAPTETVGSTTDFPDVLEVQVETDRAGTFRFYVTLSSPYDSDARYADAWRVRDADGTVFGVRELLHHHATEQPFTRSLDGVAIPSEVDTVIVEGRDSVNGWGGTTLELGLPDG